MALFWRVFAPTSLELLYYLIDDTILQALMSANFGTKVYFMLIYDSWNSFLITALSTGLQYLKQRNGMKDGTTAVCSTSKTELIS